MALAVRVLVRDRRAVPSGVRLIRRVHRDPQHVRARRDRGLAIATVQDEVLPSEKEDVFVRPADADALVAGNADAATGLVDPRARRDVVADRWRCRVRVDHAEAALRGAPRDPRGRIDELVERVVLEVEVVVTARELVQPVVRGDVDVRIAEVDRPVADVRRLHRETDDPVGSGRHAALLDAAHQSVHLLVAHDPLVREQVAVHDEVGHAAGDAVVPPWIGRRAIRRTDHRQHDERQHAKPREIGAHVRCLPYARASVPHPVRPAGSLARSCARGKSGGVSRRGRSDRGTSGPPRSMRARPLAAPRDARRAGSRTRRRGSTRPIRASPRWSCAAPSHRR